MALAVLFLPVSPAQAEHPFVALMPQPGTLVALSKPFEAPRLQGMILHPEHPLKFDVLVHKGHGQLDARQQNVEYKKLIKYFLAALTVPNEHQWVNLSPYEKDRIIHADFGKTEMGRDLLAQDYLLKQISSSLMYPESGLGKDFWDKVYAEAWRKYHTTQIPVNTFNKVWILPDQAIVYEHTPVGKSEVSAYIVKSHLKVMLEEDYLASKNSQRQPGDMFEQKIQRTCPQAGCQASEGLKAKATEGAHLTRTLIRHILLPTLEKEVNEGKNFAPLRQVVSSMVLATWYKKALKESLLGKIYADKAEVEGVKYTSSVILSEAKDLSKNNKKRGHSIKDTPQDDNELIYQRYLQAFKKGVYDYIKEDTDIYSKQPVQRKYFAGGVVAPRTVTAIDNSMISRHAADVAQALTVQPADVAMVGVNLKPLISADSAMTANHQRMLAMLAAGTFTLIGPDVDRNPFTYFSLLPPVISQISPRVVDKNIGPQPNDIPDAWGGEGVPPTEVIRYYQDPSGGDVVMELKETHVLPDKTIVFVLMRRNKSGWTLGALQAALGNKFRILRYNGKEESSVFAGPVLDAKYIQRRVDARHDLVVKENKSAWKELKGGDALDVGIPLAMSLPPGLTINDISRVMSEQMPELPVIVPDAVLNQVAAAYVHHQLEFIAQLPAESQSEAVKALFLMLSDERYVPEEYARVINLSVAQDRVALYLRGALDNVRLDVGAVSFLGKRLLDPSTPLNVALHIMRVLHHQEERFDDDRAGEVRVAVVLSPGVGIHLKLYAADPELDSPERDIEAFRRGVFKGYFAVLRSGEHSKALRRLVWAALQEKFIPYPRTLEGLIDILKNEPFDELTSDMFMQILLGRVEGVNVPIALQVAAVKFLSAQAHINHREWDLSNLRPYLLDGAFPDEVKDAVRTYFPDAAMTSAEDHDQGAADSAQLNPGGIDVNPDRMDFQIQRDGQAKAFIAQAPDMARFAGISGFEPEIIDIKALGAISILTELRENYRRQNAQVMERVLQK